MRERLGKLSKNRVSGTDELGSYFIKKLEGMIRMPKIFEHGAGAGTVAGSS